MKYTVLTLLWLIKWTGKVVGWPVFIFGFPLILAHGIGIVLIFVGLFLKEDVPEFCEDLGKAIKAGGVSGPLDAANFQLDRHVPFWNGATSTVLPAGEDTGQRDLMYPGVRQVVTDRLLAKNFCPNCHVYRWDREAAPIPPSCTCRYCGTEMEPVVEHHNGKPVHIFHNRTGSAKSVRTTYY